MVSAAQLRASFKQARGSLTNLTATRLRLFARQASTTNKPDVIKTKEEKVAENSSSAVKSFVSGGVGGIAAVLVGTSTLAAHSIPGDIPSALHRAQ